MSIRSWLETRSNDFFHLSNGGGRGSILGTGRIRRGRHFVSMVGEQLFQTFWDVTKVALTYVFIIGCINIQFRAGCFFVSSRKLYSLFVSVYILYIVLCGFLKIDVTKKSTARTETRDLSLSTNKKITEQIRFFCCILLLNIWGETTNASLLSAQKAQL